jgi:putative membrane protein
MRQSASPTKGYKPMFARLLIGSALAFIVAVGTAQAADLNDAQIAHIAYTAGQIDIAAAKLALEKSQAADVRAFAENMVEDHTAVNEQALALVKKLNVTPDDNAVSQSLLKQATAKADELTKLDGAALDAAYVANEVAYHTAVNNALETTLIPGAKNEELKALLTTGLKIFQGHLLHAENLAMTIK